MMRFSFACVAVMAAATVSAQQPVKNPQPGNNPVRADQNTPKNDVRGREVHGERRAHSGDQFDSLVADCLILGNQEEIALLKFGMERTKSNDVKDLAQSMIKDHEDAVSKLRQFASPENANSELTASENSNRNVTTREAKKVPAADGTSTHGDMFAKMHEMSRREHEQCLILNREELTKYEGREFDQAFLGQQLGAHIGMLARLKAAQEETSADLSALTAKMQETTKKHREHLEKQMNDSVREAHSKK